MTLVERIRSFKTRGILYSSILTILLGLASPVLYHIYDNLGFKYLDSFTAAMFIVAWAAGNIVWLIVPSLILGAFLGVVIGGGTKLIVKCIAILFAALVSASVTFIISCPYCLIRWQKVGSYEFASVFAWCFFIGMCGVGLLLLTQLLSNPISAENDRDEVFTQ